MFRALFNFLKSPVRTFPALAAAIGCLVSGYSTFNGISEIFPQFTYSVLAALGLATIIQLGMLTSTLAFREQPKLRPMLGFIIAITVLMSSFTSYVFYFRGFSEETIAKDRQIERHESLRSYVVEARGQTAAALGTLQETGAELRRRLEIEAATGGGLRNLSNPYLQRLIAESDLDLDLTQVKGGAGERYRFLSTVLPRVEQMEQEVSAALAQVDAEMAVLTGEVEVGHVRFQQRERCGTARSCRPNASARCVAITSCPPWIRRSSMPSRWSKRSTGSARWATWWLRRPRRPSSSPSSRYSSI